MLSAPPIDGGLLHVALREYTQRNIKQTAFGCEPFFSKCGHGFAMPKAEEMSSQCASRNGRFAHGPPPTHLLYALRANGLAACWPVRPPEGGSHPQAVALVCAVR